MVKLTATKAPSWSSYETEPVGGVARAIAHHAWQQTYRTAASNTIEAHIARLRSKLSSSTAEIQTFEVSGTGWRNVKTASIERRHAAVSRRWRRHWHGAFVLVAALANTLLLDDSIGR